jgi:hypothetical protein
MVRNIGLDLDVASIHHFGLLHNKYCFHEKSETIPSDFTHTNKNKPNTTSHTTIQSIHDDDNEEGSDTSVCYKHH